MNTPPCKPSEAELVFGCLAGDRSAFDALFGTWFDLVFRFVLGWTGNVEDAARGVRAILGAAFSNLDSHSDGEAPHAWLFSFVKRWCAHHGALQKGDPQRSTADPDLRSRACHPAFTRTPDP